MKDNWQLEKKSGPWPRNITPKEVKITQKINLIATKDVEDEGC